MQALRPRIAARLAKVPGSGEALMLNDLARDRMWSYPSGVGIDYEKMFRYPDVALLAGVAEEAQADLRVLVLLRDPILAFDSRKPGIRQRYLLNHKPVAPERRLQMYAAVLVHNYQAIVGQLRRLDPAFVRCVEFDRTPHKLDGELGQWLGVPQLRGLAEAVYRAPRGHPNPALPGDFWVRELRAAYAELVELCKSVDLVRGDNLV